LLTGNNVDAIGKVLVTHDGGRHWNIAGLWPHPLPQA
jgi:hypothetical protein